MTPLTMEQQFKKFRKKKFNTLYEQIPFLRGMEYRERTWWIRYYKLKTVWKKHYPGKQFPPEKIQIHDVKPWDEPDYLNGYLGVNHDINVSLYELEVLFVENGYDWVHVKLEEIDFPDVIDCDFSDIEGCQDCISILK